MNSKSDTIDAEITYGIDKGSPDGDMTALTIKRGNKLYTFTGEEAEAVQALLLRERIDELNRYEKTEVKFGIHQSEDMYNGIALSYNVYRKKRKKQLQSELSRLSGEESHE